MRLGSQLGGQPFPYAVLSGGMVTLNGVLQINPVSMTWTHLGTKIIASVDPAVRPLTNDVFFNVELYVKVGASYSTTYTRATGQITTTGSLILHLMNPSGSLILTGGDLIEVVIGGVTYAI